MLDLNALCKLSMKQNASDIHLKVGLSPVLRVNGRLEPVRDMAVLTNDELGKALWEVMNPVQRERFKNTNDCDLAWSVPGVARFRMNVFRQQGRIGAVLRAIPSEVKTIDELGLPPILKQIAGEQRGLVLVTGSTGCGKSTTLAAIMEEINRTCSDHILTIEDPVEFLFQDKKSVFNQREIGVDSLNFAAALRAALRQDPDDILVGELRDLETTEIAIHAAETGHIVFATLHTTDAHESVNRIIGLFPPHQQAQMRLQLASVLRAVVSQRLVRAAKGGRVAALEIMINTGSIAECIVDASRTRELRDHIAKGRANYGMQTFDQALYDLIRSGKVTQEEGLKFANNPDDVVLKLSGLGSDD